MEKSIQFNSGCSAGPARRGLRLKDNILNALEKDIPRNIALLFNIVVKKGLAGFQPVRVGIVSAEAEEKGALQDGAPQQHMNILLILVNMRHFMNEQALKGAAFRGVVGAVIRRSGVDRAAGRHEDMPGLPRQVRVIHNFDLAVINQAAENLPAQRNFACGQAAAFKAFQLQEFNQQRNEIGHKQSG